MFLTTFATNFLLAVLMIVGLKAETWQLPTATDIQATLEICHITDLTFLNPSESTHSHTAGDIRCFAKGLGLWSDDSGFMSNRFTKILEKFQQPTAIAIVVNFCNNSHKQANRDRWCYEAFNCFAKGRMGSWINEYIKNSYKKKSHV